MYSHILDETKQKKLSKAESLYMKLKEDILTSNLIDGTKLTEELICQKYNISRTPVRSCLQRLESEGLVNIVLNCGAYVNSIDAQYLRDLCQLMKASKLQCIEWTIERITDEELIYLEEVFEYLSFYTNKNNLTITKKSNDAFHFMIFKCCHNNLLFQTLTAYNTTLELLNKRKNFSIQYWNTIFEEHKEIYKAILTKNVHLGKIAIEEHLNNSFIRDFGIDLYSEH